MASQTVADLMDSFDFNFAALLDTAISSAKPGFETQFCADLHGKFQKFGDQMFISPKQFDVLKRIGGLKEMPMQSVAERIAGGKVSRGVPPPPTDDDIPF